MVALPVAADHIAARVSVLRNLLGNGVVAFRRTMLGIIDPSKCLFVLTATQKEVILRALSDTAFSAQQILPSQLAHLHKLLSEGLGESNAVHASDVGVASAATLLADDLIATIRYFSCPPVALHPAAVLLNDSLRAELRGHLPRLHPTHPTQSSQLCDERTRHRQSAGCEEAAYDVDLWLACLGLRSGHGAKWDPPHSVVVPPIPKTANAMISHIVRLVLQRRFTRPQIERACRTLLETVFAMTVVSSDDPRRAAVVRWVPTFLNRLTQTSIEENTCERLPSDGSRPTVGAFPASAATELTWLLVAALSTRLNRNDAVAWVHWLQATGLRNCLPHVSSLLIDAHRLACSMPPILLRRLVLSCTIEGRSLLTLGAIQRKNSHDSRTALGRQRLAAEAAESAAARVAAQERQMTVVDFRNWCYARVVSRLVPTSEGFGAASVPIAVSREICDSLTFGIGNEPALSSELTTTSAMGRRLLCVAATLRFSSALFPPCGASPAPMTSAQCALAQSWVLVAANSSRAHPIPPSPLDAFADHDVHLAALAEGCWEEPPRKDVQLREPDILPTASTELREVFFPTWFSRGPLRRAALRLLATVIPTTLCHHFAKHFEDASEHCADIFTTIRTIVPDAPASIAKMLCFIVEVAGDIDPVHICMLVDADRRLRRRNNLPYCDPTQSCDAIARRTVVDSLRDLYIHAAHYCKAASVRPGDFPVAETPPPNAFLHTFCAAMSEHQATQIHAILAIAGTCSVAASAVSSKPTPANRSAARGLTSALPDTSPHLSLQRIKRVHLRQLLMAAVHSLSLEHVEAFLPRPLGFGCEVASKVAAVTELTWVLIETSPCTCDGKPWEQAEFSSDNLTFDVTASLNSVLFRTGAERTTRSTAFAEEKALNEESTVVYLPALCCATENAIAARVASCAKEAGLAGFGDRSGSMYSVPLLEEGFDSLRHPISGLVTVATVQEKLLSNSHIVGASAPPVRQQLLDMAATVAIPAFAVAGGNATHSPSPRVRRMHAIFGPPEWQRHQRGGGDSPSRVLDFDGFSSIGLKLAKM